MHIWNSGVVFADSHDKDENVADPFPAAFPLHAVRYCVIVGQGSN